VRSPYSTSAPVDDLVVEAEDGHELQLMVKDLSWDALLPDARRTKPRFLYEPCRELGMYDAVLDPSRHGTAQSYGGLQAAEAGAVILEKVHGRELFQVGELDLWVRAAQWARSFHAATADRAHELAAALPLLHHDRAFYSAWLDRARRFVSDPRMKWIADCYDAVIDCLVSTPHTLIHGELYPSNVLVTDDGRVCAIDWEMAAIGPGWVDVAALTAGRGWSDDEREVLLGAYAEGMIDEDLRAGVDAACAYLAVQWLGWSDDWTPPEDRAQDWLADAVHAIERLGV
jgi:hypothetical protein